MLSVSKCRLYVCGARIVENEFVVKVAMRALGFDVKKADVLKILRDYDREGTGKISFDDFNETSKISLRNLRRVARELGENMTDEELRAMIDEFDRDGDGEINEEEFIAIITGDT
ncbi:hypothetical protein C0Q70_03350 [Pomacea canaliculata]|uniref:EF-hand domain-containing protein n=1 Tax=Pomacea canaliculata TaxID=400727 RepID=A0A2T7PSH2_POMCA|nr:hypothetical protein C0Q70_03350 [Pomacea canaliculata]